MGLKLSSVWGIEIGANSFNAVQLKKNKGGIAITNHYVFPYPKSMEKEEDYVGYAKQGLMGLFGEGLIKKNDNVFVSIPGRSIFSRPIELPPMDMRKFHELIKYEASQQIPHNLDDVVWDYHLDSSEDNVTAVLFAAHKDQVNQVIDIFKDAGLQIVGIQSSTLAILNYFRHDHNFDKSSVILDIKSKNIDFVINDGLRFWQRNIARGGDDINKALMTKFKIPFEQAEELKRNMSKGEQAEKIMQVVQPVFKSMSNEIQRSIGHYCNQHEDAQIQDGFLMGNAHRMKALLEYFKKNLRLKIHILNSLGRLAETAEVDVEAFNEKHGDYVVPLGLALQGLGETAVTINLLPPEITEARVAKKRMVWLYLAAASFLFAGIFTFMEQGAAVDRMDDLLVKGPVIKTIWIDEMNKMVADQAKFMKPAEDNLLEWQRILRDRETYFKRDAWVTAVDQIHKSLYDEKEEKHNAIYINKVSIAKASPENSSTNIQEAPNKQIPLDPKNPAATKVFKITISGTFYAKSDTDDRPNLDHVMETVVKRLNANTEYFRNIDIEKGKFGTHAEIDVPVYNYTVSGYFVPKPVATP